MQRWFLADLRTGRQIQDLRPLAGTWSRSLNAPEDLKVDLDMRDPRTVGLGLRNTATPGKAVLAVAEGDVILGAGPVWAANYDRDAATLSLTARGALSYYDHRHILPVVAATLGVAEFTIPDPSDPTKTMPNPAVTTTVAGVDLGTIAKRWMQQAHAWTGGSIPVVFPADRAGTHERTVIGAEFKNLGEALSQLAQVEGGPDIRLLPRFTEDRLGIEWALQTGTEVDPLLAAPTVHSWDLTVPRPGASGLKIAVDGTRLAGLSWATGGRVSDEVLIARATSDALTSAGFPLLETLDSAHSSVSVQSTLDGYAREALLLGARPFESWSFEAEADRVPRVGAYLEGDWLDLTLDRYAPPAPGQAQRGDPWLVDGGTFRNRIVSLSGALGRPTVTVQCMPKIGG